MDTNKKPNPLPEKVVRRHAEMLNELLPEITTLVTEEGRPADTLLSRHLRVHKELGSRDRRFLSQAVFSYFRWYGWTVNKLKLPPAEACLIGAALDCTDFGDSFEYILARCSLPCTPFPLGNKTLAEKTNTINDWFSDTPDFEPLDLADLVLPGFGSMIDPEKAVSCIEQFQRRPPTWIRSRTDPAGIVQSLTDRSVPCTVHDHLTAAVSVEGGISLANILAPQAAQHTFHPFAVPTGPQLRLEAGPPLAPRPRPCRQQI